MKREQGDRAICRLIWSMLIVGAVLLASALLWRWSSKPSVAPAEDVAVEAEPSADQVAVEAPRLTDTDGGTDILTKDPGVIDRQARMLREQAAASEKSEAGPSRLALTEEQIQEIERKQVILQ